MMATRVNKLITYFPTTPATDDIPTVMPSPFSNTPHPLAEQACLMLQRDLSTQKHFLCDFSEVGKMFGVLVVRDRHGSIGFISAFSGMMNGLWQLPGFVPQLFDQTEHDSVLSAGNDQLTLLTEQLRAAESASQRSGLRQKISRLLRQRDLALAELKHQHKAAKAMRKQQRLALAGSDEQQEQMAVLALASQHHKREFINATMEWNERLQLLQQQLDPFDQPIARIKETRTETSRQLHKIVFSTYILNNFLSEKKAMTCFFDATPPAGSGDCAGPKLIHYAQQHQLQPLALAEFWWGASPTTGVRQHGHYYPACRGKCRPILPFMLRGLDVEPEPSYGHNIEVDEPKVVYEDDLLLVVNKPAGLMSAPGKSNKDSVYTRLLQRYPDHPELRLVHRLDMATSGLLLVAKNLCIHKLLQRQFIQRSVEKRYEAILSKRLASDPLEGKIDLPLRVDFDDRPRQLVCYDYGKAAQTRWQVIAHEGETTRVYFYPLTGRTHQLRVHASHKDGLNAAIVGDALYGQPGERLMLHAQRLCFTHPVSREPMEFQAQAPF